MKIKKRIVAALLCATLLVGESYIPVKADEIVNEEESHVEVEMGDSKVEIGEGCIIEYNEVIVNKQKIEIEKRTYANNTATLKINENGKISSYELEANFELLKSNLNSSEMPNFAVARALSERYVTTFKITEHVTPANTAYATVLAAVSMVLTAKGIPGATITGIASLLIGLGGSSVEAWITTERRFYGVYDSTGYFLGYYKVYYTITTEAKVNGKRQVIKTETGTYTTLDVG